MPCIEAHGLRKAFEAKRVLNDVDLLVEEGRIVGLIGPNGAGKSTLLNAILGLTPVEGHLKVLGLDPRKERDRLMRDTCFIADVTVLPGWMSVSQTLDYAAGVHPRFDRSKAEQFLAITQVRPEDRIRTLSKGMATQLHLALVMAIQAKLMVLDEPTLGLDPIYRKLFFDTLLSDYFDDRRTILMATHEVGDIQHVVTDVIFMDGGEIVLGASLEDLEARYVELTPRMAFIPEAMALNPIHQRQGFGLPIFLFDGVHREVLLPLGEVRTPSLGDLFTALIRHGAGASERQP